MAKNASFFFWFSVQWNLEKCHYWNWLSVTCNVHRFCLTKMNLKKVNITIEFIQKNSYYFHKKNETETVAIWRGDILGWLLTFWDSGCL